MSYPLTPDRREPMILADATAWVEFDRANDSPAGRRMVELISTWRPPSIDGADEQGSRPEGWSTA